MNDIGNCEHGVSFRSRYESCLEFALAPNLDFTPFTNREQRLLNVLVQLVLCLNPNGYYSTKSDEEVALWISDKLKEEGFPTIQINGCYCVLDNKGRK